MRLPLFRDNTATIFCTAKNHDGTIADLSSVTEILLAAKSSQALPNSGALFLKRKSTGDMVITDAPNGKFTISIVSADTQSLPDGTLLFMDLLFIDSYGNVFTVDNYNELQIKPNISRL